MYPLLRAGQLAGDEGTIGAARDAARLAKSQLQAAGESTDVFFGAVGILSGLLALLEFEHRPECVEAALACGAALASSEDPAPGKGPALARLHALSGNARHLRAARLEPATPWFQGVAGEGLAGLAAIGFGDAAELRNQIDEAVNRIAESPLPEADSLLAGAFGEVAFLTDAAERFGRPEWEDVAVRRAAAAVERARSAGGYRLFSELPADAFTPGFVTGLAGIGYELLRLACPGKLPSAVLFE
jgi:lantibiotic modifying enzyme